MLMKRNTFFSALLGFLCLLPLTAARPEVPPVKDFETQWTRRSYPLLAGFIGQGQLEEALRQDSSLHLLSMLRASTARAAANNCKNMACMVKPLQWNVADADNAAAALMALLKTNTDLQALIQQLRTQHAYPLYEPLPDADYLRKAWLDAVRGQNYVLSTYLLGTAPRYAKIDSLSIQPADRSSQQKVRHLIKAATRKADAPFYQLSLEVSAGALALNGRNEAVRYEPISAGINRAPYEALSQTKWEDYPYSAIVVPGLGPETLNTSLDSNGAKRCMLAAASYQQHKAPYIIVSGGHVHPYKTPYAEAVEMKKYLVAQLHIPDVAVIIEPYARHTTTNLRNAARIYYSFNMPANKPLLVVSDALQSLYIGSALMAKRCKDELGYVPFDALHKAGKEATILVPLRTAFQADPLDPLDP